MAGTWATRAAAILLLGASIVAASEADAVTVSELRPDVARWALAVRAKVARNAARFAPRGSGRTFIRFAVAADGRLVNRRVLNATSASAASAALRAVAGVGRFPPRPSGSERSDFSVLIRFGGSARHARH